MSNVTKYVRDAFKSLDLLEDTEFELDSKEDFEELDDFINADGDIPEKEVIDLEAETEEEVKDSYIGEVILECPVCHSDHFDSFEKAQDYIETYKAEHDDEEPELVFEGEACPVCGNEDGFKIVGKVAPFEFEDEEEDEVEVETDDDDVEVEVKEKEEVKEALKRKVRKSLKESKKVRRLKESLSKSEIAKFIKDAKDGLLATEDEGGCYRYVLDDDLCLYVGWESGYEKDNGHDGWDIAAKIGKRNDFDWADYEYNDMPFNPKTGDVWDTSTSADPGDADWFISQYEEIRKALDNGEIVLESMKSSKSLGEGFERKLEPGDTIVVGGSKVTVGKILDQYFDKDYIDIEFEDESGNYRTWKSDVDGGKVIYKESRKSRKGRKLKEATTIKGLENAKNVADEFKNYAAYKANFKPLVITKQGKNYFVYKEGAEESSDYVQFGSKEYIDGWLYGCVQAKMKIVEGKKLKEDFDIVDYYEHNKEVPDVAYEMASEISDRFSNQKEVTWDEFNAAFEDAYPGVVDWTEDAFNELETDVRGVLNQYGWETVYEGENEGGLRVVESRKSRRGKELTEAPVYELRPQYDSRQSFYGKAQVDTGDKNDKNKLYSYGTLVAEIKDGKPVVYGTYSQTTLRHIKDWLKQNGFKADSSKQILTDYGVKDECVNKQAVKESTLKKFRAIRRLKEAFKKNGGKKLTEDKGDLNKLDEDVRDIVGEVFDYTTDFDFLDIVADILLRTDDYEASAENIDIVLEDLDSGLIYGDDQWEVLRYYFDSPGDLDSESWNDAFTHFAEDIQRVCSAIVENKEIKRDAEETEDEVGESLSESIESATIETKDQVINVSSEDKEENMLDDFNPDFSNFDEVGESNGEEMIAPLSDEEVSKLSGDSEEEETVEDEEEVVDEFPEDEEEFEFDEVQEESFNRLVGNYLNNVYSNAKSFKLKEAKSIDGQLKITGTIDFKSGKSKDTTFIFEKVANRKSIAKNKARFVGLNETFTDKKNAYVLRVSVKDKKLVAESLRYDYPAKGKLNESVKTVKGLVK